MEDKIPDKNSDWLANLELDTMGGVKDVISRRLKEIVEQAQVTGNMLQGNEIFASQVTAWLQKLSTLMIENKLFSLDTPLEEIVKKLKDLLKVIQLEVISGSKEKENESVILITLCSEIMEFGKKSKNAVVSDFITYVTNRQKSFKEKIKTVSRELVNDFENVEDELPDDNRE